MRVNPAKLPDLESVLFGFEFVAGGWVTARRWHESDDAWGIKPGERYYRAFGRRYGTPVTLRLATGPGLVRPVKERRAV